ncbi:MULTISPECIES: sucrase ferredoxin [unclassified Luteococcus]|uniref:sucrase ferredoxin n=1 Tax=unclassified Luteococcus TaxID=2639923 RepID=UPI00313F0B7E
MTSCSDGFLAARVPAFGTAPDANFWVALEQPGPWGAKAFTQSRLDADLGSLLERTIALAGGRLLLVRDPLSHPDEQGPRRVLVGAGPASAPWLASTVLESPEELVGLLELWGEVAESPTPPSPLEACEPVLLVCTNGKRDVCCAVKGAPLARELAGRFPGRVWEATHLGGHRFASTALGLPSRQMLAFVDGDLAVRALDGKLLALDEEHDRGRSDLPRPARVADCWLRSRTSETDPGAVDFAVDEDLVTVTHRDGRTWSLRVTKHASAELELPESCGKPPVPVSWWAVNEV